MKNTPIAAFHLLLRMRNALLWVWRLSQLFNIPKILQSLWWQANKWWCLALCFRSSEDFCGRKFSPSWNYGSFCRWTLRKPLSSLGRFFRLVSVWSLLACSWRLCHLYFVGLEVSWVYLESVGNKPVGPELEGKPKLKVIQDSQYRRLSNTVDMQMALEMFGRHTWVHFMFRLCLMIDIFLDRVLFSVIKDLC